MVVAGTYVRQLCDHELAVADLYMHFSSYSFFSRRFWRRLSREEVGHSKLIEALARRIDSGELAFSRPAYNMNDIKESRDFIDQTLRMSAARKSAGREALLAAISLEEGMIERGFFFLLDGDSEDIRIEFEALSSATVAHIKRLRTRVEHPLFSMVFPHRTWCSS